MNRAFVVLLTITIGILCLLWGVVWSLTGFKSPDFQWMAIRAHGMGPATARTLTEFNTSMGLFHAQHAARSGLNEELQKARGGLPSSWGELIKLVGGYRGSHMNGPLIKAYPFLQGDLDPWGNAWIYRVKKIDTGANDTLAYEITLGSLGPDGVECPGDDVNTPQRLCDDQFHRFTIIQFPTTQGKSLENNCVEGSN